MSDKKKSRLNLELDAKTKALLDRLKDETEASSLTDVIRRALRLLDMVVENQQQSGTLVLRHDGTDREIFFVM